MGVSLSWWKTALFEALRSDGQSHSGSTGTFGERNRERGGLCDSGEVTECPPPPLSTVLSCGMCILGPLTFRAKIYLSSGP